MVDRPPKHRGSSVHESGRRLREGRDCLAVWVNAAARLRAETRRFYKVPEFLQELTGRSPTSRRFARLPERSSDARASARESIPPDRVRVFTTAPERHKQKRGQDGVRTTKCRAMTSCHGGLDSRPPEWPFGRGAVTRILYRRLHFATDESPVRGVQWCAHLREGHGACSGRGEAHADAPRRISRARGLCSQPGARNLVEEIFGWAEPIALFRETGHRGVRRVGRMFTSGCGLKLVELNR
jgi:hypothetical protein